MIQQTLRSIFLLAVFSIPVFAQNTAGTGSIAGTVTDVSGAVVPGASVVVENVSKGIRRQLETTEGGVFNAPSLVPAGGYSVTVSLTGFANYQLTDITLNVGQTVTLTPKLSVSASATTVDVSTGAEILDTAKPDVSSLVTSQQILDLPINGRRVDAFVLLTPGVTSDAAFGLLTFRGLPGGNSFLTDGVDTTNQFYDENAGRTRTYNISQDAVQEFQVITSGSLAEYGRASGGVVNTITRSGSNDIHGTGYWFFRNRTLNATDISSNGLKPQDWRHQAGVSVGGPIVKDKLFFFFNGELQRRFFPLVSSNVQNNLFLNPTTINPAACGAPATPAQCAAANAYIYSRAKVQTIDRNADVNLLFGKIDYQLNEKNRLTFEMNYVDFRSPNGIQTQVSLPSGAGVGNNANTTVFDRTGKAGLTTILSANLVNEAKFGYFKDRQYDPASASLLPTEVGPVGLSIGGQYSISNIGFATSYPRLNPSEQRFQYADTVSYTAGKHSLKFGFDYANTEDYVKSLANQYGTYSYSTVIAFAQDFSAQTADATRPLGKHWNTYTQRFGQPVVDTTVHSFAAFLQDQFRVNSKLTISPGIRWEKELLPQQSESIPNLLNPALPQGSRIPQTSLNFMPRFGLAYSATAKTVIRADYGMFYNRYPTGTINSFFGTNGVYQPNYTLTSGTNAAGLAAISSGPAFPFALSAQPSIGQVAPNVVFADLAFRPSYSQQASASIERELDKTSSITVSYIWSRALHLVSAYDTNVAPSTSNYTYPVLNAQNQQVGSYTTPLYTTRLNRNFGSILDVTSSNNSYYNGMVVQYRKRYSTWFQGQASYTYSHAIDYNIGGGGNTIFAPSAPTSVFNGNYSGEKGSASTDQRHRLVANGTVTPKFTRGNSLFERFLVNGWQLSAIMTAASAQPLVPTINAATGPTRILTGSLNGLGGSGRVPFESISALDGDQLYRTDARLSKILPFGERFKVTLMFEAFNVFNHPFYSGSAPRLSQQYFTSNIGTSANPIYAIAPQSTYGTYSTTSAPLEGTTARRAQAALRFEF